AMGIRFQHGDHRIDRYLVAAIDPGMDLHDRHRRRRLEDEQADDALRPGRAGFRKAGDDDITWPRLVTVPVLAVAHAIFDSPERSARKHMFSPFRPAWWSGVSLPNQVQIRALPVIPTIDRTRFF